MNYWETNGGYHAMQMLLSSMQDIAAELKKLREEVQKLNERKDDRDD